MVKIAGFEIPDEPEIPFRIVDADLEHHATALGYLCMSFAHLELQIDLFIGHLLDTSNEQRRCVVGAAGAVASRCILLTQLASLTPQNDAWEEHWFNCVVDVLDGTHKLCEQRNRLVHDPWLSGTPVQLNFRPKLRKAQAGKQSSLVAPVQSERSLEAMWDLVGKIEHASHELNYLLTAHLSRDAEERDSLPPPRTVPRTHCRSSRPTWPDRPRSA